MAATPDGHGYWLVASDGGIFNFGDAAFYGSTGGSPLNKPIVGMAATPRQGLLARRLRQGHLQLGNASFYGSTGGALNKPIVGMAATPSGRDWLVASDRGIFNYGDASFDGSRVGRRSASHRRHGVLGGSECGHLSRLLPRYSTSPSHGYHSEPREAGPRKSLYDHSLRV